MNPFQNLSNDGLEAASDRLGGNFGTIDTDVYTGTIKAAYAGKSQGGAHSITAVLDITVGGQKREYKETIYVTNRQGENFYPDKTDANKKQPLPGFTTANDLALLSTGLGLNQQEFEERVINVYDPAQSKEVPTKVQMAVSMVGKPISVAIIRETKLKQVKDNNGNYVDNTNGETRDENRIDKVFHAESGRTVSEVTRKLEKGEFIEQWREKNKGVTRDKTKGKAGEVKQGMPGMPSGGNTGGAAAAPNLFGG